MVNPNEKLYAAEVLKAIMESNARRMNHLRTGWTRRGPDKDTRLAIEGLEQDNHALAVAVETLEAA